MVLQAVEAVDDAAVHVRWFGRWDDGRAETVRQTLLSIDGALRSDVLRMVCPPMGREGCTASIFAWVMPRDLANNLCPSFFTMPGVAGVVAWGNSFETGTREGTIVHEVSHFEAVGGTGISATVGRSARGWRGRTLGWRSATRIASSTLSRMWRWVCPESECPVL